MKDFIDLSLEELQNIDVFVDNDGNPIPIITNEDGAAVGIVDTVIIETPKFLPKSIEPIIRKEIENPVDKLTRNKVIRAKPAYFYTSGYQGSKLTDSLRVTDIIDLSLEDLLDLEVTVGGQSFVNLIQSSLNSLIITEEVINRTGYTSIGEILMCLSSFNIFDNDHFSTGVVRGTPASNFNEFVILINGRQMNSLFDKEAYLSSQYGVQNIKQIEINYGPSQVDLPSEAYSGSINIVTKDFLTSNEKVDFQVEYNTPRNITTSLALGTKINQFQATANIRYTQDKTQSEDIDQYIKFDPLFAGNAPEFANGIAQEDFNNRLYVNKKQALFCEGKISLKDIYVGGLFYNNTVSQNGLHKISLDYRNATPQERSMMKAFAGIDKSFNENNQLNVEYQLTQENISGSEKNIWVNYDFYNENTPEAPINDDVINQYYSQYFAQNGVWGSLKHTGIARYYSIIPINAISKFLKGDLNISLGYEFNFNDILGLNYSTTSIVEALNTEVDENNPMRLPQYQYNTHDAFGLIRKSILNENLFLSLGLRYSIQDNYNPELLIRSEISLKLGTKTYLKAGYNQGVLRPAVAQMLEYDGEDAIFNNNLQGAKSSVANAGINQSIGKLINIKANFFQTKFENHLLAVNNSKEWQNSNEELITMGVETKLSLNFTDNFNTSINYTYQKQQKNELNYYPHNFVLFSNYNAHRFVGINIVVLSSSSLKTIDKFTNEIIELPWQTAVNLNLSSKAIPLGKNANVEIIGSLKNIFNKKMLYPNVNNVGSSVLLGRGRLFTTKLILKF